MSQRPALGAAWALALALTLGCSADPAAVPSGDDGGLLAGGDTTAFATDAMAFGQAAQNLKGERRDRFFVGNSLFNRNWVTAPASTSGIDGLGPTFNARSCSGCHFKDGRGRPPFTEAERMSSMLIRLSVPGEDEWGGPLPEPSYGGQLNPHGILGVDGEGDPRVSTRFMSGEYDDGAAYELSVPSYEVRELAFGALSRETLLSPRVAPAVFGLGLLQAVEESTILGLADEADQDADGISGRANLVFSAEAGALVLGRFGWKANQPSLNQQNAGALLGDLGITSSLFPDENCPAAQAACLVAQAGGEPEIDDDHLADITYYTMLLAVPARRDLANAEVRRGELLFTELGCDKCHTPTLATGHLADFPEVSEQLIHPYTDLLLHDLGDALADGRPDFLATGNEWRTPPLWGIGLVKSVNDHTRFLHDGRARSLEEAVLWHGGEAEAGATGFKALALADRTALLSFLQSL